MLAVPLVLALPVGVLVGAVGVGGLLLPAALAGPGGLDPHQAAATSSWAFLFTGVVALVVLARTGRLHRGAAGPLALGAVPGAVAGALVGGALPGVVLVLLLAAVTLGSGLHHLLGPRPVVRHRALPPLALLGVGVVVGLGSAMTGTGGPVLLVPVLLALGVDLLEAIALGQLVQLPIVSSAVVGFWPEGYVDVRLGTVLGVLAAAGAVLGLALARRVPAAGLRRATSVVLVATGAYLVASVAL
ncbi:TSUP family transporter [Nocardioides sp. zg-579]|uniref:Probable membrane transporter protein n=1 Tax=Nocardioides marmotae TaxID=2663857 RepID=A0A6I3IXD4_9ACTN|nr:sulfite exporter TauE/SafE family protein [Nocardioides marmotae]MCR6031404.1 TSUP family transporter [Gordonia jinghuaiqii]MTB95043.1 TSUP family transporter [Nocardioides marmotae]QKE02459.1 sulfite exporter TauE/SafE family protein [Nocardioides marmotae]